MYALAIVLMVALLSLIVARIASVALSATGMTHSAARFQARSALSGVGYTTGEAELVVNHPVRRRVVMALMLLGNIGLVTAVAGLLRAFVTAQGASGGAFRLVALLAGLTVIYVLSRSSHVDRVMTRLVRRFLHRYTDLDVRDYASLLHVAGDYGVTELLVQPEDWLADESLGDLRLRDEGVLVLGVARAAGTYLGAPGKDTVLHPGDTVVLYGRDDALAALDDRRHGVHGDHSHRRAVSEQERIEWGERQAEEAGGEPSHRSEEAG